MASSSARTNPPIGILSIGGMGMGVANLLLANNYPVLTVSAGRSQHTIDRIRAAGIKDLPSDEALVTETDIILSIVPPRDCIATAKRVADACGTAGNQRKAKKGTTSSSVLYIDLNAVSPRTAKTVANLLSSPPPPPIPSGSSIVRRLTRTISQVAPTGNRESPSPTASPPSPIPICFLDGGIIGGPPQKSDGEEGSWKLPSIVLSGPDQAQLPESLISLLNVKFISTEIGAASTLKCCFASLTKGLTALAALSYTTAQSAGVLEHLTANLEKHSPMTLQLAEKGLEGMPPKAYRWVDEMRQIGETFADEGGFSTSSSSTTDSTLAVANARAVYDSFADVYKFIAEETVLGAEKIGKRKRGKSGQDVAAAIKEGIDKKRKKSVGGSGGPGDEKLELTWRGSWS